MELYRFIEITLYALLRIVPFLALMVYVFRKELRFSDPITWGALGAITLARIVCAFFAYADESRINEANPGFLLYVALSILLVKAHFGKSLFTMLMLNNFSTFTVVAAKSLEGVFFPELALELHRWSNSLMLLAVEALVLLPLFLYLSRVYKRSIEQNITQKVWNYLWCIPMTLYIVGYRNLFLAKETFQELALSLEYAFYSFLLAAGGMLIYTLVTSLINERVENDKLKEREYELGLQHTQYHNLQDRIEEARRAKHDIRKHIHVMSAYLKDKKYDELEVYLNRYKATLPEEVTLQFCENYAVNALLQYFCGYCKMIGAGFSASVNLSQDCGIPDEALTVVLGNLLENATEACVKEGTGAVMSVRSKTDETAVFFKIVNTCAIPPKKDGAGNFLSSKRKEGTGIGLDSVRKIAEAYNGMMKAGWEDGVFTVSVMLVTR